MEIKPTDATNTKILWSVLNPEIATVDDSGVVTGVSIGKTEVIAQTEDGGFQAKCLVNVVDLTDKITADAIIGATITGKNSFCTLTVELSTHTNIPVFIESVSIKNELGNVVKTESPRNYYTEFVKTIITHYFDANNGISGEDLMKEQAKLNGWTVSFQYVWNDKVYILNCKAR